MCFYRHSARSEMLGVNVCGEYNISLGSVLNFAVQSGVSLQVHDGSTMSNIIPHLVLCKGTKHRLYSNEASLKSRKITLPHFR